MPSVTDALAAAKLWLISAGAADLPYLSQGLFALVAVESDAVETVAADEHWRLYVHPDWVTSAPVDEVARELAHQLWHLLLDHAGRARALRVDQASASAWGDAADLAVSDALRAEGVVPVALAAGVDRLRVEHAGVASLRPGCSVEEYFAALGGRVSGRAARDDSPEQDPAGEAQRWAPETAAAHQGAAATDGSAADAQQRSWEHPDDSAAVGLGLDGAAGIRRAVAVALLAERGRPGEVPGELERWARALVRPEIGWERLLAQAARRGLGWTSGRTHTTYSRPNRRAASVPGVLLPGWRRQSPAVACVIDTSGSVDEGLLGRALSEVDGALRALGVAGSALTVLACDASVQSVRRVRHTDDAALIGGGGTDMRVALAEVERLRPRPTLTVVFTDGLTPWPDAPPPGCAVVVALLLREGEQVPETPEWASVIECRDAR